MISVVTGYLEIYHIFTRDSLIDELFLQQICIN